MKDFEASCLLMDALRVAKTSAIEDDAVKSLLNSVMVLAMGNLNKLGEELFNELYEKLESVNYFGNKSK